MASAAHAPVLCDEAVDALQVRADGCYVDCTFGRGGHSRAILARLGAGGQLVALDRDPQAIAAGRALDDPRLVLVHSPFSRLPEVLARRGIERIAGVLLDLGVSSPQLDAAERGFSFRADGPLDMRMDPTAGESAAQFLASAAEPEIARVIKDYGEERFAKQIARAVVAARTRGALRTTRELAALVAAAVRTREPHQDPATRTFQALRIHVNQECEELSSVLAGSLDLLAAGGRLVVVSFHSLEDRIVKRFIRDASGHGAVPERLPLRASEMPQPRLVAVGKPVRPSAQEVATNPRARSAVMRVAERTNAP
ncbi:MAG TPA: 16S rRNA (cytosine(1402)-N(4))-methyltransferase RsmH [Burkholderiales bacterium]|nr:16S rRNA (cytosine(1402)-N(4))-methyltransferase RsmH [Betaproteobacteria bacterium]HQR51745.1 16S rRNA (cytosine(1402)-N(4))-methyltransferase RsmH [Burkholderiales bacterium]